MAARMKRERFLFEAPLMHHLFASIKFLPAKLFGPIPCLAYYADRQLIV